MKVLFLAAEATPFAKAGGLADVAGELPKALSELGVDIRVALPLHSSVDLPLQDSLREGSLSVMGQDGRWISLDQNDPPVTFIDGPTIQAVPGIYGGGGAAEGRKFVYFSLGALQACEQQGWQPDLVHANDWHTAGAILWLAENRIEQPFWNRTRTLYTVHNLPYLGVESGNSLQEFGLATEELTSLPDWAQTVPSARGIALADWLSTVSPTYALQIQTEEYGSGLDPLFLRRRARLAGILNGIDPSNWDPASDPALCRGFDLATLDHRLENKRALQKELGLAPGNEIPLLGMVTRLDRQKGVDLTLEVLDRQMDRPWQFVLLGTGDPGLEQAARDLAERHADRVRVELRFDGELARRIYGGSDIFLIPSRYEPCGLTQMIAMRYGSVPLVRATGGLIDTVRPASGPSGTGYLFPEASAQSLMEGLNHALDDFREPDSWRRLQENGMREEFCWRKSARDYHQLYETILSEVQL